MKRLGRGARDLFPLTGLGVLVGGLAALALYVGFSEVDLVLLGAGVIGGLAILVGVLSVGLGLLRIRGALNRLAPNDTPLVLECGYPVRTGFRLPRLMFLPGVQVRWRWREPAAKVRLLRQGGWAEEEVTPERRGWSETLTRRIEIGDPFGLAAIAIEHCETRPVRMLPSVGGLKQMHVVRTLSGGSDLTHPDGSPEGDRLDLRSYSPGDPIKFVLWNVFARTRQLVVRTPEKAISSAKKTLAYLVSGQGDEPAAGAARVAVDVGALGGDWAFGADGVDEPASTKDAALEALARSATADPETSGAGLASFVKRAAADGAGRAIVFVPGRPGPWLDGVVKAAGQMAPDSTGRVPLEFVVCTDGVQRAARAPWLKKIALREREEDATPEGLVASEELARVVATLGKLRARVLVVDRRDGHVHMVAG